MSSLIRWVWGIVLGLSATSFAEMQIVSSSGNMSVLSEYRSNLNDGAEACDDGISSCQVPVGGGNEPGAIFRLTADEDIHIEADVWSGFGCGGALLGTFSADLTLPAGDDSVYIPFDPPPPTGTVFSFKWRIGACAETACFNHVIGVSPGTCATTVVVCAMDSAGLCTADTYNKPCGEGQGHSCQVETRGCACH